MIIFDNVKQKKVIDLVPGDKKEFSGQSSSKNIMVKVSARNIVGNGIFTVSIIKDNEVCYSERLYSTARTFKEYKFVTNLKSEGGEFSLVAFRELENNTGKVEISKISFDELEDDFNESVDGINSSRDVVYCVVPYGIYGGAEVYLKDLVNSTKKSGIFYNFLYVGDNKLKSFFKHDMFTSCRNFNSLSEMEMWIKNNPPDVFLYYNRQDIYDMARNLKKDGFNSKIVEIYHSDFKWPGAMSNLESRGDLDTMIITYPDLGSQIQGVFERRVVPIPIDTDKFQKAPAKDSNIPFDKTKKVIGTVSRLSKEKNVNYILDLAIQMGDFQFVIVGGGPEESRLKSRVKNERINNVYFAGYQDNTSSFYNWMDAFVMCSDMEGTSISVLEAMSSMVPVFSNFVGGISHILTEDYSGIKITGDAREDSEIIRAGLSRTNLASNARSYVLKNHSTNHCADLFKSAILGNIDLFKKESSELSEGQFVVFGEFV